jgi:thiamine-phosphate pyrophosphorylase
LTAGELAERLSVIVIVEREVAGPRDVLAVVDEALEAGAPAIQLRNKGDSAAVLLPVARALRSTTRAAGALFFVNDRVDIAVGVGADGVHLGPDDIPVAAARATTPPGFLIGRSADDAAVARQAVADGASYIGCGTVYETSTKADAGNVIGLDRLREVVSAVDVPVVGIGGISVDRVSAVRGTGAAGVAVVGAVMAAEDPAEVVRRMLERSAT